ncbi:globin family protein [Leptothoe spongobia]|uniref:Uncharacterized protein n=1 Tax=Leptothoe spongobia TAU-MAC 1115 TaxID=1967444 RepID=A0A947DFG7_9CYAN|nr:hypothetical protein [Leptothoe spongobia]MBT9315603.1 hypothetical protein [Leptothoe spongobia TAU-MAC 1115]
MPNSFQRMKLGPARRLVAIWTARYCPDFSSMEATARSITVGEIYESLLVSGRKETATKLNRQFVMQACKLAAIRTKDLYVHFEDLNLKEITNLAQLTSRVYLQLIQLYQLYPPISLVPEWQELDLLPKNLGQVFRVKNLLEVADVMEPFVAEFRLQHIISDNWKTLGFMTTQVNLTNMLLLQSLNPVEKALISPYFKFLEEQIVMPWQRMFAASAAAPVPAVRVVERMLPIIPELSIVTYTHWQQTFPYYYARRGSLEHPEVKHSSLRDFSMFQVYLWLSFLQGNLRVVEAELAVFCRIVYGEIGIPWGMTIKGTKLLMEKVLDYLEPHELKFIAPYTSGMVQAFMNSDETLLSLASTNDLSKLLEMG